jgi:hypothetical protein
MIYVGMLRFGKAPESRLNVTVVSRFRHIQYMIIILHSRPRIKIVEVFRKNAVFYLKFQA